MAASFTIEEYLTGLFDYDIPQSTFKSILYEVGIEEGTQMSSLETPEGVKKTKICKAKLYEWLAKSSLSSRGEYESDGGWQHQKATKNVADRKRFYDYADAIYAEYNMPLCNRVKMVVTNV